MYFQATSLHMNYLNWLEECPSEIWENVFSCLQDADTRTLTACRETCSNFKYWVDTRTSLWSRMSLRRAAQENNVNICNKIIYKVHDKNPADEYGLTLMHWATYRGHLEIVRLFIDHVQDKNPADNSGLTPLHWAAELGHLEICRLIIENVRDKNPSDSNGLTPLSIAEREGHLDIFHLIRENVHNKNPVDQHGTSAQD